MSSLGTHSTEIDPQVPLLRDRRRCVRHKVHLPAYARLSQTSSAPAVDLSEIIDLSEQGMAIQSCSPLPAAQRTDFFLDFSELGASIGAGGQVVWSDTSGRAGIQFADLAPESILAIKKWLFANAIAAYVNPSAEARIAAQPSQESLLENEDRKAGAVREEFEEPAHPDYTTVLSALAVVRKEVESLGSDLEGALFLIAHRALAFTHASGAAIALAEGPEMICRARAGTDAPDVGARLRIGSGFSGECVRSGALLRCDDSETDPRVDRESCHVLGIRSMVAVPIRWGRSIPGLLEIFSPRAVSFGQDDETILTRLGEMVSEAVHRAGSPQAETHIAGSMDDEFPVETVADLPLPGLVRSRNILLTTAAATIVFVIAWLIGTWDFTPKRNTSASHGQGKSLSPSPAPPASNTLEGLRKLAGQGDASSQFALGARYHTGEDVPQDYSQAFHWFSLAAEQGNVPAQATLGAYYWAGRGVAPDWVKAYFWSLLAEAAGDEASKQRVALLASRLNRSQLLAAQQQANDWIREHQYASKSAPAQ